jgi:hypothetical protein
MPDEQHDPLDGIAPVHYLDETFTAMEESQRETPKLLGSLRGSRILFYPACYKDWNPLHRFTHLCDTFVYCDYNAVRDEFRDWEGMIRAEFGLEFTNVHDLDTQAVMDLATPDEQQADDFPIVGGAWGKVVNLTRHIGSVQRKIRLLYFRAEGATLYRNLFNKRFIAPRMVCLKQCQDGFGGQNWTTFLRWDGPLGRAVWENRGRPEFIVSAYAPNTDRPLQNPQGHCYDWPWSRAWQEHRNWQSRGDARATQLTSYVLESELRASAGTPKRFHGVIADNVTARPINQRTIVRLKRPPYTDANLPDGARIVSLRREGRVRTLQNALRELGETCADNGTQDVHSVGCHFEDEAPALYAWKWNSGTPKTLTIHCESAGDLACYGPVADEVLD